jgi:hypothetical protein
MFRRFTGSGRKGAPAFREMFDAKFNFGVENYYAEIVDGEKK